MSVRARGRRRRLLAEINVVPYIDVMLVLLVIFMVTAPLITQGVRVELPQAPSEVMPPGEHPPLVLSVDREGRYYAGFGEARDRPLDAPTLLARVVAVRRLRPDTPVLVRGDRATPYGAVVGLMAMLERAGVARVGLVTEPPPQ